ncbi:MAG: hypothetical protein H6721_01660 [Sandaracinus sp.]|nr:hypothetical protein [Myxococcales bacterium]MCB9600183.1 hypothetical protein [Sandaracinus sp.]MCB9611224.1 hypothetical protein [Sandaracinus sp.]MCB9630849.1 hypothetical protein [Sandaracinus sp.]
MANDEKDSAELRELPVSWEALEDAFENNAPEVHSYLHVQTGEVIRIVDGVADPQLHQRIMSDSLYLRVDPVSSREQYRWMERFIATVEDPDLQGRLIQSIDGKGAFRRFKDVLMSFPVDRERWFTFRSERLRACMEGWLAAHDMRGIERPAWPVPTADDVKEQVQVEERRGRRTRAQVVDALRVRLHELADVLPARELDAAVAFLEFLRERRPTPRAASVGGSASGGEGEGEDEEE